MRLCTVSKHWNLEEQEQELIGSQERRNYILQHPMLSCRGIGGINPIRSYIEMLSPASIPIPFRIRSNEGDRIVLYSIFVSRGAKLKSRTSSS